MSKMNSDFVVKYFDSWIEKEYDFNSNQMTKYLLIKMELCSINLKHVITSLKKFKQNFKTFHYFICCELFKELTKAVNYLHSNNIIHRDLKPENVVTTDGRNGIFLKLCDFNLSKALGFDDILENDLELPEKTENKEHTRNAGTRYYLAPEIKSGKLDQKSDIYCLALIATEIFSFEDKYESLRNLFKKKKL